MSKEPYFNWYQNSNNIKSVPSVIENVTYNSAANFTLPPQRGPTDYDLPRCQENTFVINYGNVHYNGSVDAANYVHNPYTAERIDSQHEIIRPAITNSRYHNNLVDLTWFNDHTINSTTAYSTHTGSPVYDKEAFNYDYYTRSIEIHERQIFTHQRNISFEEIVSPVSTYQLHHNFVKTSERDNFTADNMSTKSKVMKKYSKYEDLRNVIVEKHTNNRSESKSINNKKDKEKCKTENIEKKSSIREKREIARQIKLDARNTIKLKKSFSNINNDSNKSFSTLSESSSKNTRTLERENKKKSDEPNPGVLERKTHAKAQKRSLSPDALQRFLAYQRFLRNCHKNQSPSPQKIRKLDKDRDSKDKKDLRTNKEKPRVSERKEKSKEKKVKLEETKSKVKSKKKIETSVDQNSKKAESKSKVVHCIDQKAKKRESKIKVTSYVEERAKKRESKSKELSSIEREQKRKEDEVNEKLTRYLEKKKKRQELKERLFGKVNRKKQKTESEARLIKYLKQYKKKKNKTTDTSKKSSSRNLPDKHDDEIDLRAVLTRKRTRNPSHTETKRIKTTSQHEKLIITVEQGVNGKVEPSKVTQTVSKVKAIKSKRIKLVINIVCPNSTDSDEDENENNLSTKDPCTSPHQDLSFLDDFNVDEIVDSLTVTPSSNTTHENNSSLKKKCLDKNVCTNEFNTTQTGTMQNINEDRNPLSQIYSDVDQETLITNATMQSIEHQLELLHNEQRSNTQLCEMNTTNEEQNINIDYIQCENNTLYDEQLINISDNIQSGENDVTNDDQIFDICDNTRPGQNALPNHEQIINIPNNAKSCEENISNNETNINISDNTQLRETPNDKETVNIRDITLVCESFNDKQIINICDSSESLAKNILINQQFEKVCQNAQPCDKDESNDEQIINICDNTEPREMDIINDEGVKTISDTKASDATGTRISVAPVEYCDDVYEVIDITDDTNGNIIILEDVIDLDSNDHFDNIDLLTESSKKLKEKAETILLASNKIIQNLETNSLKDQSQTANEVDMKTDPVMQNTELRIPEIEIINNKEINITGRKTEEDINTDNTNTVLKEAELPEIKDSKNQHLTENISITKIEDNLNVESLLSPKIQTNTKLEDAITPDDKITSPECSVLNDNYNKEPANIDYSNTLRINSNQNQDNISTINNFDKDTNNQNYEQTRAENIQLEQSPVVPEKDKVVSNNNKGNKTDNKHSLKVTASINNTNITSFKIPKITKETNDEVTKQTTAVYNIQPNTAENTNDTGHIQNNSNKKNISNVAGSNVINNHMAASKTVKSMESMTREQANRTKVDGKISPSSKNVYIRELEKRMSEYLNRKFIITAIVHRGYFSNVYKCKDAVGESYALKILKSKYRHISIYKDKMISDLQKSSTEENYFILKMIESFKFSGEWCFLSDYYPKTLEAELKESGQSFHIDKVQILARQLVSAVAMLTNNKIIHSDIKPSHILLNSTSDKLKLCSLDRSGYNHNIRIIPSSGTASYRAPEIILGYEADYRIDVWSTALVMYEMATGIQLFPGRYNNDILYKQLCTLGPLDYDMLEKCSFKDKHFLGTKFMRQVQSGKWTCVPFYGTNNKLHKKLFSSYNRDWRPNRTQWQVTEDLDKIEMLYKLLHQMLVMDPKLRLPITFVGANEFIYDNMSDSQ